VLAEIRLENYRGFADHVIPFGDLTVLIGRNNAGKSTVVEALRLVGEVVRRFRGSAPFVGSPQWLDDARSFRGIAPVIRDFDFDERTFFYGYGKAPAIVTATFTAGTSLNIFIGPLGEIHAVARDDQGRAVASAGQARLLKLPDVRVQPQLGPLLRDEKTLMRGTVVRGLAVSPSIHFRNQLNLFYEQFADFKALTERTWPQLQVLELEGQGEGYDTPLYLLVRDGPFVADAGLMGHGLQLQMMWFLARAPGDACVVLDEPDVYMHPDLQHQLVGEIGPRFEQLIVATHSVEIISTVDPQSLVVIDRERERSVPLMTLEAAQAAIDDLGGVQSIHAARLYSSERFVLVEGDDVPLLAALQQVVLPKRRVPFAAIPAHRTYGWGGWHHAINSSLPKKNGVGTAIRTYCFFDSDFHTDEEIEQRYAEADARGVQLHIWHRKEIENYVLVPTAIARYIGRKTSKLAKPSEDEVAAELSRICKEMKNTTVEALADELQKRDRKLTVKGSLAEARKRVSQRWATDGGVSVVEGSVALKRLKTWAMKRYGVSFTAVSIAQELAPAEVPAEVKEVLGALDEKRSIPRTLRFR
jgi:hypothetical protein